MNHCDIVLINGTLIDEKGSLKKANIGIKGQYVHCVTEDDLKGDRVIDCTGKYISASFANAHSHLAMNLFKGIAEDVDIDTWFNTYIWPYESNLDEQMTYTGAKLAMYELIENGVTVVADHYFNAQSIIDAAVDVGINLAIAPTLFGAESANAILNQTLELKEVYKNQINIELMAGPHSPYLCDPSTLETVAKFAKANNLKVHIHVGETQQQLLTHLDTYKQTPLETLSESGILDVPCILAHNLWYQPQDLTLLRDKHYVALCPKTYGKLGMSFLDLNASIGTNWVMGTDGAASSNSLSVLEQVRLLALKTKESYGAGVLSLNEVWRSLHRTHECFGFETGKILEGSRADLVIWDLNQTNTQPVHNVLAAIIYSSDRHNIEYVISNGKVLKDKFKVLGHDVNFESLLQHQLEELMRLGKGKPNTTY